MIPIVRLYPSEKAAKKVVSLLMKEEIPEGRITTIMPSAPDPAAAAEAAIESGAMRSNFRGVVTRALADGQVVVCVTPPYGQGQAAMNILDAGGAVATETLPADKPRDPTPFSDFLGFPVLTEGRSHLKLASSDFTFSSMFGLGLLSRKATPLSSLFGLGVLQEQKGSLAAGSPVERMSGEPAPLSSKFGMNTLTSKRGSTAAGSAVERMSGNPAPFSDFLGIRVLSRRK
jgi:hypothetical protein